MKHLWTAIVCLSCCVTAQVQTLTYGQIFDFSPGDITYKYVTGNNAAAYLLDTVLTKSVSMNNDTIFYSIRHRQYVPNLQTQSWNVYVSTYTTFVTNLNSVPGTSVSNTNTDSLRKDTSYIGFCGKKVYAYLFAAKQHSSVSAHAVRESETYIEGLGYYQWYHHNNPSYTYNLQLLYYKKGAAQCGTLTIPTGIEENNSLVPVLEIFPNPAKDFVHVRSLIACDGYKIFDTNGRELLTGTFREDKLEVKGLPDGLYFLNLYYGDKIIRRRLLIE